MRTCIITAEDSFYSPKVMNEVLKNKFISFELVIIPEGFITSKRIYSTFLISGLVKFIKTVFQALYNIVSGGIIKKICTESNIQVFKTKNINSSEVMNKLKSKKIDLIISIMCPQIIKNNILEIPKVTSINVHLALLPKYRGLFPLFHAFIRDEEYIGVSVHIINTYIDDGNILSQKKIKIEKDDNLFSLYEKSFNVIPELIFDAINKIISNDSSEILENKKSESSYYSYPNLREIRLYHKKLKS